MKKLFGITSALLLFVSLMSGEETNYTNYSIARLSHITGNAFIQRASDLGYEECDLNTPITEGDRLGTTDGRAEIYFGRSSYFRLDENTKIDFLNLPKKGDELVRIRIWSGNVYIDVGQLSQEKSIEIHTADTSFYVLDKGLYRVDVNENKETEILVFRGLMEAAGEEGSILIKAGQRMEVAEGRFISRPSSFITTADDAFDRWNNSRNNELSQNLNARYLPRELEDFEGELSQYGNWVSLSPYGHVWCPRGMGSDWRPYYDGRWIWLPLSGWTWVPGERWGWATFHYGRWHWGFDIGWYWIPTSLWGPAWVDWWWDNDYFTWAPLSWWGYPVVIIDRTFYGHHYGRYYPHNSHALIAIHKDQLKAKNISRVALRGDALKSLNQMSLSSPNLPHRPVGNKTSIQSLDGKKILIRKDESRSIFKEDKRPVALDNLTPKSLSPRPDKGEIRSEQPSGSVEKRTIRKENDSPAFKFGNDPRQLGPLQEKSRGQDERISKRTTFGYPSSRSIDRSRIDTNTNSSHRSRFIDSLYKYFSGESRSLRKDSSSSGSNKSSLSGSPSRGSSSSSSNSASSHRGSSSNSHSTSSGSLRKKD